VARFPITDDSHRTTRDMWLYRAYSGNLYHNGEQSLTLPGYTQGDYITCVLDMEAGTLSLGKNGEVSGDEYLFWVIPLFSRYQILDVDYLFKGNCELSIMMKKKNVF